MNTREAFALFEQMIQEATNELINFTVHNEFSTEKKADKSVVTACDKQIDMKLTKISQAAGLQVVSEEGSHVLEIVKSGNYITIDPIDGTLGYIDYVNNALETGDINNFLKKDLGAKSDFCLLLGIVEKGMPQYGACYNYVTKEKILIDGNDKNNFIRENNKRNYSQQNAVYLDQRLSDDPITNKLISLPDVALIKQATVGLKTIYTITNPHQNSVTVHRVQSSGLWDIMPTAAATRVFGGEIFDDKGNTLKLNEYILLPGNGTTVIKGDKFLFVKEQLKS